MVENSRRDRALYRIRLLHTCVWAIFASAIVSIPILATLGYLRAAVWMSVLVWAEVAILCVNGLRCPLTGIAERYTEGRTANFDIFLPLWLAKNNKLIFGGLFALSEGFLLFQWVMRRALAS